MMETIKRLLVVEDDIPTRDLLKRVLVDAGYKVTAVSDAPDALNDVQQHGLPHMILIDLGLPTMHGFELAERIKRMGDVPIIILTGEDDEDMVVRALDQYAEDYMIKPFKPREVAARIRRVLSRMGDFSYAGEPAVHIDDQVAIDFTNSVLQVGPETIPLTPIEVKLLWLLVHNANRVVRSEQLFARVWPGEEVFEETLRVHMSRLRRKFTHGVQSSVEYIHTERGTGYMFCLPEH